MEVGASRVGVAVCNLACPTPLPSAAPVDYARWKARMESYGDHKGLAGTAF